MLIAVAVYMDNLGAILMASNVFTSKRSKRIDLMYHTIRVCAVRGLFKLECVSADMNATEIMTSAMVKIKHVQFTMMSLQSYAYNVVTLCHSTRQ